MPPRWQAIAETLTEEIRRGEPQVGDLLPGEMALCDRFGASRITLRHALAELTRRGLLSRRRGAGTRVEAAEARDLYVHGASNVEEVLHFTADLFFAQLGLARERADAPTAALLGVVEGAPIVALRGLRRTAEGLPLCLSQHRIPLRLAEAAMPFAGLTGSLATHIAHCAGEQVETIRQTLEAVLLTPEEAAPLIAQPGAPALLTRRVYAGRDGRVLLISRSLFPAGRYVHSVSLRRAGMQERRIA
jgi:DNA-binding GntR family transcriptional regulator